MVTVQSEVTKENTGDLTTKTTVKGMSDKFDVVFTATSKTAKDSDRWHKFWKNFYEGGAQGKR